MGKNDSCHACGICCDLYGATIKASKEDLSRWKKEGRSEILSTVDGEDNSLWCDGKTGEKLDYCPWLVRDGEERAHCSIHETKPATCREYPTALHQRKCVRGIVFLP